MIEKLFFNGRKRRWGIITSNLNTEGIKDLKMALGTSQGGRTFTSCVGWPSVSTRPPRLPAGTPTKQPSPEPSLPPPPEHK